jgi:uncharacterized protein
MEGDFIIDFHTHFFPDNIADKAVANLSQTAGISYFGNGTSQALQDHMEQDGITLSINQPVATKVEQVVSINRQMVEFNKISKKVISFGTLHPDFSKIGDVKEEISFLAANSIKGIKLHPEYQEFYPDDPRMTDIYQECRNYGLLILSHAGKDLSFKEIHGTPKRFAEVAKIKSVKIVLAHLGGYQLWEDVENYLVGLSGVYFDTAYTEEMELWQMKEIIMGHGGYKVLFGSDFPWQKPANVIKKIKSLDLGKNTEDMIFYKNAKWLLDM